MPISSYSSPFNLGHKAVAEFFDGTQYYVEEKVDGSQFSFGMKGPEDEWLLMCRSHNTQIDINNPGMFGLAVKTVKELYDDGLLIPGWTYRGEFLQKPKHNTLKYDRVPQGNIILFDIDQGEQEYLSYKDMQYEAQELGLECVPLIAVAGGIPPKEYYERWLNTTSILGGTLIEGVVLKLQPEYAVYGRDKKLLMVKIVSEAFKETNNKDWKQRNPNRADVIDKLIAEYGSIARWQKAVQHLEEDGELVNAPEDIGKLLKEIAVDFEKDCAEEIGRHLWEHFRKQILRGVQQGFPEWYKEECLK